MNLGIGIIKNKYNILMYLVSIFGIIEHTTALVGYFWANKTIFGFSIFAGHYKVVGECFGIILTISLAIGIWKKYATPILIYWLGMMIYFIFHILYYLPYFKLMSLGLKFKQLKFALIPGIITTIIILLNIGCTMGYLALYLQEWRAATAQTQAEETKKTQQAQEVRAPDAHINVNFEFENIDL